MRQGVGQGQSEVDGRLASELQQNAVGVLAQQHLGDALKGQRVEVQPVAGVEVRGHGLRVVVDDDSLVPEVLDRPCRVDTAVVELDSLPYPNRARANHRYALLGRACQPGHEVYAVL